VNPSPENLPVRHPGPGAKEMDSFRLPGELNNTMLRRVENKIKLTTPAEHQPIPDSRAPANDSASAETSRLIHPKASEFSSDIRIRGVSG
jgi:hypothetical protein